MGFRLCQVNLKFRRSLGLKSRGCSKHGKYFRKATILAMHRSNADNLAIGIPPILDAEEKVSPLMALAVAATSEEKFLPPKIDKPQIRIPPIKDLLSFVPRKRCIERPKTLLKFHIVSPTSFVESLAKKQVKKRKTISLFVPNKIL